MLADAPFRDAIQNLAAGEGYDGVPADHVAVLRTAKSDRVGRFARFLARQYYLTRVTHFHRYSRALARWTHRYPEEVIRGASFEALLPALVIGSREAAESVAALLEEHLLTADSPPYTPDLVRYQNAQLIAEAGPRTWRSDETRAPLDSRSTPALGDHTLLLELGWDLPALLPALLATARSPEPMPEPPRSRRARLMLLFTRSARGRISVVRCTPALVGLLRRLDGSAPIATAATDSGIELSDAVEIVNELAEAGAWDCLPLTPRAES
jgi:hypothetical protein